MSNVRFIRRKRASCTSISSKSSRNSCSMQRNWFRAKMFNSSTHMHKLETFRCSCRSRTMWRKLLLNDLRRKARNWTLLILLLTICRIRWTILQLSKDLLRMSCRVRFVKKHHRSLTSTTSTSRSTDSSSCLSKTIANRWIDTNSY